jgi:DUF438 domain-containing protein
MALCSSRYGLYIIPHTPLRHNSFLSTPLPSASGYNKNMADKKRSRSPSHPDEIGSIDALVEHLHADAIPDEPSRAESDIGLDIVPGAQGRTQSPDDAIALGIGSLTLTQLNAIFSILPVDLTFVDANDRVRFISEGPDRVFIRPKTIIGRKVQHCHPAESLDKVERILSDFKSGKERIADFWLNFQGRFVFIRYFALHDEHKNYMGTLEVTQDLTRERALVGERRLLEYDQ